MRRPLDILYNLHWVIPNAQARGVARSAQPYLGFYNVFLAGHRFKSLINLRGENAHRRWWRQEAALAERLGIAHFNIALSSRRPPSRAELAALFDAFAKAQRPVLMKCSGGQDRTSLAAALYLLFEGRPLAEALAQFARWPYLHRPKPFQIWLRHFPEFAMEAAKGKPLAQWAREDYRPEEFAAYLAAHGVANAYRGLP